VAVWLRGVCGCPVMPQRGMFLGGGAVGGARSCWCRWGAGWVGVDRRAGGGIGLGIKGVGETLYAG